MDQLVYTAQPVVEKFSEFIFVKLDGDHERELIKRYGVEAYPTIILVDCSGKVIRMAVGYQSAQRMLELLSLDGEGVPGK